MSSDRETTATRGDRVREARARGFAGKAVPRDYAVDRRVEKEDRESGVRRARREERRGADRVASAASFGWALSGRQVRRAARGMWACRAWGGFVGFRRVLGRPAVH